MLANELMGLGLPARQAVALGYLATTVAGVGTAQSGAGVIPTDSTGVTATTASGQTALILPSDAPLWQEYVVYNSTATAALVFPPSGNDINAAGANASVSIAQNLSRRFIRVSATHWVSYLSA